MQTFAHNSGIALHQARPVAAPPRALQLVGGTGWQQRSQRFPLSGSEVYRLVSTVTMRMRRESRASQGEGHRLVFLAVCAVRHSTSLLAVKR